MSQARLSLWWRQVDGMEVGLCRSMNRFGTAGPVCRFFAGMTDEETAQALQVTVGTVAGLNYEQILKLRPQLVLAASDRLQ